MVIIPLTFQGAWNLESYSKIPPNIVTFSSSGMAIKVNQSASPIVYSFGKEKIISELIISGEFKGLPKFTDTSLQGQKKFDDYALRIGLIVSGEKRLSGIKKIFSPEWIKRIYASIPSDSGIDYVQFYNVTQNQALLNSSRIHPTSDLIHENFFAFVKEDGHFNYSIKMDSPKIILGLWISVDGDDTKSSYEVDISKIELNINP
jgi:hypothetical protein